MNVIVLIVLLLSGVFVSGFFRVSRRVTSLGRRAAASTSLATALDRLSSASGSPADMIRDSAVRLESLTRLEVAQSAEPFSEVDELRDLLRRYRDGAGDGAELAHWRERLAAHIGALNARQDADRRLLINPVALFIEGAKFVFSVPVRLAGLAGWLDRIQVAGIEQSRLFHYNGGCRLDHRSAGLGLVDHRPMAGLLRHYRLPAAAVISGSGAAV